MSNVGICWANKKLHDSVDFANKILSFRLKLILEGTLISKIDEFGAQRTQTWSFRSRLRVTVWRGFENEDVGICWTNKKRSIFRLKLMFMLVGTLISNIDEFGAQETHTEGHNEWLFNAAFGGESYSFENENSVTIKINRATYCAMIIDFFFCIRSSWYWCERCLASTECCNFLQISCHNRFIVS